MTKVTFDTKFEALRYKIAVWISPALTFSAEEEQKAFDARIDEKIKETLSRNFILGYYGVSARPEDGLSSPEALEYYLWAFTVTQNAHFKKFMEWGTNYEVAKMLQTGKNDDALSLARATILAYGFIENEMNRLAQAYESSKEPPQTFDPSESGIKDFMSE